MELKELMQKHEAKWDEWHMDGYGSYTSVSAVFEKTRLYLRNMRRGDTVLDIGCGDGRHVRWFAKRASKVFGLDISEFIVGKARSDSSRLKNVYFVKGNGYNLNTFPKDKFDFIYSSTTFQLMPKRAVREYLKDILRVLKPHGFVLFQLQSSPASLGLDEKTQLVRLEDPRTEAGHLSLSWKKDEIEAMLNGIMHSIDRNTRFRYGIYNCDTHPNVVSGTDWYWTLARKVTEEEYFKAMEQPKKKRGKKRGKNDNT